MLSVSPSMPVNALRRTLSGETLRRDRGTDAIDASTKLVSNNDSTAFEICASSATAISIEQSSILYFSDFGLSDMLGHWLYNRPYIPIYEVRNCKLKVTNIIASLYYQLLPIPYYIDVA